jgi:hypothetical protein
MAVMKLTAWQEFQLWVSDDAIQLGMEVITYYMWCSLLGAIQGLSYARAFGLY